MVERKDKIAIVGIKSQSDSDEERRWDCISWTNTSVNLHEYDTWVLFPHSCPTNEQSLYHSLNFDFFYKALLSGTTIYVVGDPRIQIERCDFLHWTGFQFHWNDNSGDTKKISDLFVAAGVQRYLEGLSTWKYALRNWVPFATLPDNAGTKLYARCRVQNRVGEAIATELRLTSSERYQQYGSVLLLPAITDDNEKSSRHFLKTVLNISLGEEAPDWVAGIVAPGQQPIDYELQLLDCERERILRNIAEASGRRAEARKPIGLLYQTGFPLEETVIAVLQELGAQFEPPSESNKEDGAFSIQIGTELKEFVLEVKSTGRPMFSEEGIRQLGDWINRGKVNRQKVYRGIFVGNSAVEQPPSERQFPFSDSWVKAAKLMPITALTTETLFKAYEQFMAGRLNPEKFWSVLFSTDGIVMPDMF